MLTARGLLDRARRSTATHAAAEELGELGMTPTTGSIAVGEYHPGGEVEGPGGAVEGKHEPLVGEAGTTEAQAGSGSWGFGYCFRADG